MEKLFIIVVVLLTACSCGERREQSRQFKYKTGDVVYVKPDSSVAVVIDRHEWGETDKYSIKYEDGNEDYINEFEIYGVK